MGAAMSNDFDEIVAGLDLEVDEEIVPKYREWPNLPLMREHHRVKLDLNERGVLLHPKTDEDKDLQGYYLGLSMEMRRRGLL